MGKTYQTTLDSPIGTEKPRSGTIKLRNGIQTSQISRFTQIPRVLSDLNNETVKHQDTLEKHRNEPIYNKTT